MGQTIVPHLPHFWGGQVRCAVEQSVLGETQREKVGSRSGGFRKLLATTSSSTESVVGVQRGFGGDPCLPEMLFLSPQSSQNKQPLQK